MSALGRKASGWHHLLRPTWARVTGLAARLGEQKRKTASLCELTTASDGGGLDRPRKHVPEPGHGTSLTQCLPEKQRAPVRGGSLERAEAVGSLRDMGFTDIHATELLTLQPGTHPQQLLGIVSELILLGVNPEPVCVALKNSPHLLTLPVTQMKKRSSYLRKLGLGEGKLKRVLHCCPEILTMRQQDLASTIRVLREKCLFTVQQVTEILHRCPHVLREDPGELEYKFQYGYFRMGVRHADLVRTGFLQFSITKTRQRHVFLERLGRYQTPDKKGQTQVPNPSLSDILRVSEAEFLARTACSTAEEFEVFKKLLAREEEEEPKSLMPGDEGTSDEDTSDEGEGEGEGGWA